MLKFIRTTHDAQGQVRHFPPAAWQFWQEHGHVAGQLLRPEEAMTFAELLITAEEHAFEFIADGPQPTADAQYLAWCLLRLVDYGMAAAVITSPAPPEPEPAEELLLQYAIPNTVTLIH